MNLLSTSQSRFPPDFANRRGCAIRLIPLLLSPLATTAFENRHETMSIVPVLWKSAGRFACFGTTKRTCSQRCAEDYAHVKLDRLARFGNIVSLASNTEAWIRLSACPANCQSNFKRPNRLTITLIFFTCLGSLLLIFTFY